MQEFRKSVIRGGYITFSFVETDGFGAAELVNGLIDLDGRLNIGFEGCDGVEVIFENSEAHRI